MLRPRRQYSEDYAHRPGTVTAIRGIVFQSDGQSTIGRLFIRPFEALDRIALGILPKAGEPLLAMHAGIHVVIDDSQEYVAEQLVGSFYLDFRNGLNWTPFEKFKMRDRGGWDVTVSATNFRTVDDPAVGDTVERLNRIHGHPFVGEDCTQFIERAFGGRRLFADSPLLGRVGLAVRVGDPALPLLRPDAQLDEQPRRYLQFDKIKNLADPAALVDSPNVWLWGYRLLPVALAGAVAGWAYSSASRRSTPISSTARKFLR